MMDTIFNKIIEGWYIYDNALFEISLTHSLKENPVMSCPMRCGRGLIEYNPDILRLCSKEQIEELLKVECIRIILKHPYERQPMECSPIARAIASDIVIADGYNLKCVKLWGAQSFGLELNKSYEWYAHNLEQSVSIQEFCIPLSESCSGADSEPSHDDVTNNSFDSLSDKSELWEEDTLMESYLDSVIEKIESSHNWGSIPGDLVERIVANACAKIDYRKVLSGFRASVLSSKRNLTRMRPNRRTGFDNMGNIRRLCTRLLVGIDVSDSVSSQSLRLFLSVVNKAFKYGIEELDLVTFDTMIHDKMKFKKAKDCIEITGRGGTDFQPVIDYAVSEKYDGLIVFTDGCAPTPMLPPFTGLKVAWVIDTPENFKSCYEELSRVGRCCVIEY